MLPLASAEHSLQVVGDGCSEARRPACSLNHFQELKQGEEAPTGSGGLFLDISQLFLDCVHVSNKIQWMTNYCRMKQLLCPL